MQNNKENKEIANIKVGLQASKPIEYIVCESTYRQIRH